MSRRSHVPSQRTLSQRQLRVGEMLRHALSEIFARGPEIPRPDLVGVSVTVTEIKPSA
jgi:ribosome-binding factor A